MADGFQPKFVDLVRNTTTTSGTGNFTLGPPAAGYTSFTAACQVGDRFYYSAISNDKAAEHEVGRGTLLAGGIINREPISGTRTNFSNGTKSVALIAAAEWFNEVQAGSATTLATRSAMMAAPTGRASMLVEPGHEGLFLFDASNRAADVAGDPRQGIYVAPSADPSGASGAWVRTFNGPIDPRWFGALLDNASDDGAAIAAAIAASKALAGNVSVNGFYKGGPAVRVPAGRTAYLGTTTLDITHSLTIEGEGSGKHGGAASRLRWAAGATGIRTQRYNTSGVSAVDGASHFGGDGLTLRNIKLEGGFAGVEGDFHGVHAKTPVVIGGDVWIHNFQGEGIRGRAIIGGGSPDEGNFSASRVTSVSIESCRIGAYVAGPDANVVTFDAVEFVGNRQAGYVDDSGIGANTLIGCHSAQNGVAIAGIIPTQCSQAGNRYAARWGQEVWCSANPPSGSSADNQGWLYVEPGAADAAQSIPAWTSGTVFRAGGAYLTVNDATQVHLVNCYAEDGQFSQFGGSTMLSAGAISERYRRGGGRIRASAGKIKIDGNVEVSSLLASGSGSFFGQSNADPATVFYGQSFHQLLFNVGGTEVADIYGYGGVGMILKGSPSIQLRYAPTNTTIIDVGAGGAAVAGSLSATGAITSAGGGIGYATGAGGAVAQTTSKSSGVMLNKPCGQITTSGSALAANASVSFIVTNGEVAATDTIDLALASGNAAPGTYNYQVDQVSAGSFAIWLKNISAGSLAETLVFNFAVRKAVNA